MRLSTSKAWTVLVEESCLIHLQMSMHPLWPQLEQHHGTGRGHRSGSRSSCISRCNFVFVGGCLDGWKATEPMTSRLRLPHAQRWQRQNPTLSWAAPDGTLHDQLCRKESSSSAQFHRLPISLRGKLSSSLLALSTVERNFSILSLKPAGQSSETWSLKLGLRCSKGLFTVIRAQA